MIKAFFQTYSIVPHKTLYVVPHSNSSYKNSTLIQTTQGPITVPYSLKTVLKKFRMLTNINESFVRQCAYNITKKKNLTPIPIHPALVLMPVKIKVPESVVRVYGYVNVSLIESIEVSGQPDAVSSIVFQNHLKLPSPQSIRSLEHNRLCAKVVQDLYFAKCAEAGGLTHVLQELTPAWPEWEPV